MTQRLTAIPSGSALIVLGIVKFLWIIGQVLREINDGMVHIQHLLIEIEYQKNCPINGTIKTNVRSSFDGTSPDRCIPD